MKKRNKIELGFEICITPYYYHDEDNTIIIDEGSMREEFENRLKELIEEVKKDEYYEIEEEE